MTRLVVALLRPFASPGAADEKVAREKLAGHDYTRISGGQRQLALIARARAGSADPGDG